MAALLVCDVQERFSTVIHGWDHLISSCVFLLEAANALSLPVFVSEQYPKGLGRTVGALQSLIDQSGSKQLFEKTAFSMWSAAFGEALDAAGCNHLVLCGLETHICVLQTCIDITRHRPAMRVSVVTDAVSSSRPFERAVAVRRLASMPGVVLTTCESLVFELLGGSTHPAFKRVSGLVKAQAARLHGQTRGQGEAAAEHGAAIQPVLCTLDAPATVGAAPAT